MSHKDRVTIILKTPNPLFETWLLEWIEEANKSGSENKREHFQNALGSLRKFPLLLKSGRDCMILQHFDVPLCTSLDRKLAEYNKASVIALPQIQEEVNVQHEIEISSGPSKKKNTKSSKQPKVIEQKKKVKEYVPTYRSAAYALLITLANEEKEPDFKGFLTKAELQSKAQSFTDTCLKRPQAGSFYSGWSAMTQLVSKGLVIKASNPPKFSLSDTGRSLSIKLKDSGNDTCEKELPSDPVLCLTNVEDVIVLPKRGKQQIQKESLLEPEEVENNSVEAKEEFVLFPNTFEIILLVDTGETGRGATQRDATVLELTNLAVKFEIRHLKVGDFTWIARENDKELVLPYIVERKRMDDLAQSIKDGRFHEQKFRLKRCSIQNLIYLIEDYEQARYCIPTENLMQAITNTMVSEKFTVKRTANHVESMKFLASITAIVTRYFKNKTLFSCEKTEVEKDFDIMDNTFDLMSFKTFSQGMGKNRLYTPREMLIKQLVQLHGMSSEKAWAITALYGSHSAFIKAFQSVGPDLIANVEYGLLKRKIGPKMSELLHAFYTLPVLS